MTRLGEETSTEQLTILAESAAMRIPQFYHILWMLKIFKTRCAFWKANLPVNNRPPCG